MSSIENPAVFSEEGISVDDKFLRKGDACVKVAEIIGVQTMAYRTDGHMAPILWGFAIIIFIFWIPAPEKNAFMLFFIAALAVMAFVKQQNPKPVRYRVLIRASGSFNTAVHDTTDAEQAERLRFAIETAMARA